MNTKSRKTVKPKKMPNGIFDSTTENFLEKSNFAEAKFLAKPSFLNKRKTVKANKTTNKTNTIVEKMTELIQTVKLFHWKTRSFAQHKASDELYEKLNENVDKFVEVMLGKDQSRISAKSFHMRIVNTDDNDEIKRRIFYYKHFLIDLGDVLNKRKDSDLLSIRDDILADLNQFLYLMSFDK